MIRRMAIKGFRSHKDTALDNLGRVNWFLGKNGSGKSSIIDAIAYAMTGVCRGTDRGGKGAETLLFDVDGVTASQFAIAMETEKGTIARYGPGHGPNSQAQKVVDGMLGKDASVLQAMTDLTHILDIPAKEQQALLEQVLAIEVSRDIVKQALGKHGALADEHDFKTVDDLIRFEEWVRQQRLGAKRDLERAPVVIGEIPEEFRGWTAAQAGEALGKVEAKLKALYEERGEAKAKNTDGRRQIMEAQIKTTEAEVAALTKALRDYPDRTEEIRQAVEMMARKQEAIAAMKGAQPGGDGSAEALRLQMLESKKDACFCCGRAFTGRGYSKILDEARAKVQERGQGSLGLREEETALRNLDKRLQALQLDQDKHNAYERDVKAKGEAILNMKTGLTTMPEGVRVDTTEVDARIAKGETLKRNLQSLLTVAEGNDKARQRNKDAAEAVQMWEEVVALLGPSGLRSRLVAGKVQVFQDKANILLKSLGMQIRIASEPFRIIANGRPTVALSETERMRVGIGLQMTLANMAGMRFVCIDRLDAFDSENYLAVRSIVDKVKGFQFFLCATNDEPLAWLQNMEPDWRGYSVKMNGNGISEVTPA